MTYLENETGKVERVFRFFHQTMLFILWAVVAMFMVKLTPGILYT